MEKELKEAIYGWLKTKRNYIYYNKSKNHFSDYSNKLTNLLIGSLVHYSDLSASDCYIIENKKNSLEFFYHKPHYRLNFMNFNKSKNEYVSNIAFMCEVINSFTSELTEKNKKIALSILQRLENCYLDNYDKLDKNKEFITFKDMFENINKNNYSKFINDVKESITNNYITSYEDFKIFFFDKMKFYTRDFEEIGIYYPFKFEHNIFNSNFYLLEINRFRHLRKNTNLKTIVQNFVDGYNLNISSLNSFFSFGEYKSHFGLEYDDSYAYFNPIKHYDTYKDEYEVFSAYMKKNDINLKDLIFLLFGFFNVIQYFSVISQHEKLILNIERKNGATRYHSIRNLIKQKIILLEEKRIKPIFVVNYDLYILKLFLRVPQKVRLNKNTIIDELDCFKEMPLELKRDSKYILDVLLSELNTSKESNLNYVYKSYLNHIVKNHKFNKEEKKVLSSMILDIILYDTNKNEINRSEKKIKEHLSNSLNKKTELIYSKLKKYNMSELVDFNLQDTFFDELLSRIYQSK